MRTNSTNLAVDRILFFEHLIEAKLPGGDDLIGATLVSLGDHVSTFMKRTFSEIMDGPGEILSRLGLGALTLADQSLLQSSALKAFVVKETDTGPVASTPILARWAIMNGQPEWKAYELSMEALHAVEYERAVACLSGRSHGHQRLRSFVVSAAIRGKVPDTILSDQTKVARIPSKTVQRVRNPYAHTEAVYNEQDAKYLIEVSDDLMTARKAGALAQNTANPLSDAAPKANDLIGLLYGDFAIDEKPAEIDT